MNARIWTTDIVNGASNVKSCLGSMPLEWAGCVAPVWLGYDIIMAAQVNTVTKVTMLTIVVWRSPTQSRLSVEMHVDLCVKYPLLFSVQN
jgi:hypothetical protein